MPLKLHHLTALQLANKHSCMLSAAANAPFSEGNYIIDASTTQLASLQAKTLCSHLKSCHLSTVGSKLAMANCLHQFLHPTVASAREHDLSRDIYVAPTSFSSVPTSSTIQTPTAATISTSESSGIQLPQQIVEQLFMFLQQFSQTPQPHNDVVPTCTSISTIPTTPIIHGDADELLSAVPQPTQTVTQNEASQLLLSTSDLTLAVNQNQPVLTVSHNQLHQSMLNNSALNHWQLAGQSSLPPLPPHIRDCIIHSEYTEFSTLLPKTMFSGNLEP